MSGGDPDRERNRRTGLWLFVVFAALFLLSVLFIALRRPGAGS